MKNLIKVAFFSTILFACNQSNDLPTDLVAQVNDTYLVRDQLNYGVPAELADDTKLSMKKMLIKQWVENEIIYQTALNEGVNLSESEEFQIENYKKSLLVQHYLDAKLNKNYLVSQKEIEDYYKDNSKEFVRSQDEVHIIHLLIENRDNAIFNEIRESNDLNEIIKKYYFDTRSTFESPNGDIGYVALESLPALIQNALKRLKTGAISAPLQSDQGFHFVQLLDSQKAGSQIDLEIVKDEIERRLKWKKREQERQRIVDELKEKFQVQTYLSKVQ
ncbi:MAG: peptidylprolyl isomerase [Calditrichae bacterium]|nr:peptidylprolyl isomerase [Calditrichia bacterium]